MVPKRALALAIEFAAPKRRCDLGSVLKGGKIFGFFHLFAQDRNNTTSGSSAQLSHLIYTVLSDRRGTSLFTCVRSRARAHVHSTKYGLCIIAIFAIIHPYFVKRCLTKCPFYCTICLGQFPALESEVSNMFRRRLSSRQSRRAWKKSNVKAMVMNEKMQRGGIRL